MASRRSREGRPSPAESATLWNVGHEKRGQDDGMWHVSADTRGIKRWKKGYSTLSAIPTEKDTKTFIKDGDYEDTEMSEEHRHRGIDDLMSPIR